MFFQGKKIPKPLLTLQLSGLQCFRQHQPILDKHIPLQSLYPKVPLYLNILTLSFSVSIAGILLVSNFKNPIVIWWCQQCVWKCLLSTHLCICQTSVVKPLLEFSKTLLESWACGHWRALHSNALRCLLSLFLFQLSQFCCSYNFLQWKVEGNIYMPWISSWQAVKCYGLPGVFLLDCLRVRYIQPYTFLTEVCCILGCARAQCNLQKI